MSETDHSSREHAPISISGLKRGFECPGHYWLCKDLPDLPPSEDADWGTETHQYGSRALDLALKSKSPSHVYNEIEDEDMLEMTQAYVDFCIQAYSRARAVADKTPKYYIEQKIKLTENVWGTADFLVHFVRNQKDYLIVIDLKTGYHPHFASKNDQLRGYVICACATLNIQPEEVYAYIYQPRVHEEGYDKNKVGKQELGVFKEQVFQLEKAYFKILENGPSKSDFKVGDHCYYCKARAARTCKYFEKSLKEEALIDMDEMEVNPENLPAVKDIPVAKLIQAYRMKKLVTSWLSELERQLMHLTMRGTKGTEDLKIVGSRSSRKWKTDKEKVAAGLKKLGVKDPWQKKIITIGTAEKMTKKGFDHLTEKTTPKAQLVFQDDPREAIDTGRNKNDMGEMDAREDTPDTKRRGKAAKKKVASSSKSRGPRSNHPRKKPKRK